MPTPEPKYTPSSVLYSRMKLLAGISGERYRSMKAEDINLAEIDSYIQKLLDLFFDAAESVAAIESFLPDPSDADA